jgi:lipase chaperone LimK
MSDAPTVTSPVPEPTPVVTPVVTPVSVLPALPTAADLSDPLELLKYSLKVVSQIEVLSDLSDAGKATMIVHAVKATVQHSELTDAQKETAVVWCDVALPYVIQTVVLVKAELQQISQVALVEVKKCCPSFFAKKV